MSFSRDFLLRDFRRRRKSGSCSGDNDGHLPFVLETYRVAYFFFVRVSFKGPVRDGFSFFLAWPLANPSSHKLGDRAIKRLNRCHQVDEDHRRTSLSHAPNLLIS